MRCGYSLTAHTHRECNSNISMPLVKALGSGTLQPAAGKGSAGVKAYEALANAIIVQAALDYRTARRRLRKHPGNEDALRMKREVEQFFVSGWFELLSDADGQVILERLKGELE